MDSINFIFEEEKFEVITDKDEYSGLTEQNDKNYVLDNIVNNLQSVKESGDSDDNERGYVNINKALLMDQGYTYIKEIVFYETFSLVARLEATELLLCLSSLLWFKLYQMDLKSVFLNR